MTDHERGPLIRFARYTHDGETIELFDAHTEEIDYIAVSYAWNDAYWRPLRGFGRHVLLSQQKLQFLEQKLPKIVGSLPFWLDVIVIDQTNQAEVIAIVKHIPNIFKNARKTIAVREGDGFFKCCAEALGNFDDRAQLTNVLGRHMEADHEIAPVIEHYLNRFWTLQELLLSHTVEFTTCIDELPKRDPLETRPSRSDDDARRTYSVLFEPLSMALDATLCLGLAFFRGTDKFTRAEIEFIQAYVGSQTITRERHLVTDRIAEPFSQDFRELYEYSQRKSTKPRDYIFATMATTVWYNFPHNAKSMSFSELFLDLHQQAKVAGHYFIPKFTCTEADPDYNTAAAVWTPSSDQPTPTCFGNFILLLGFPLDEPPPGATSPLHLVGFVAVTNVVDNSSTRSDEFLQTIIDAMAFSPRMWGVAQRSGELSRYGSSPEAPFDYRERDLIRKLQNLDELTETDLRFYLAEFDKRCKLEEEHWSSNVWVTRQAMEALSLFQSSRPESDRHPRAGGEWNVFCQEISQSRQGWPPPLREKMSLLAAMLSCKIPLSAALWTAERYNPVKIWLSDRSTYLGLISKRHDDLISQDDPPGSFEVLLASQTNTVHSRGRGLTLNHPVTKRPIGFAPDFINAYMSREEWTERTGRLYSGLVVREGSKSHFAHIQLDNELLQRNHAVLRRGIASGQVIRQMVIPRSA